MSVDRQKKLSRCSARKNQGKQKGEGNRLKIDKNSDKTRVVGFSNILFLLNRFLNGVKCQSILMMLEEIGFLSELWVRIPNLNANFSDNLTPNFFKRIYVFLFNFIDFLKNSFNLIQNSQKHTIV
jgi:hypothetical protein